MPEPAAGGMRPATVYALAAAAGIAVLVLVAGKLSAVSGFRGPPLNHRLAPITEWRRTLPASRKV